MNLILFTYMLILFGKYIIKKTNVITPPIQQHFSEPHKYEIWRDMEQNRQKRVLRVETIISTCNILECIDGEYIEMEELREVIILKKNVTEQFIK